MSDQKDHSIIEDLALVRENLKLAIVAGLFGAFMPFTAFWISHFVLAKKEKLEHWQDCVLVAVVVACILFSVTTVWKASSQTSKEWYRAPCWVVALEGTMIALPPEVLGRLIRGAFEEIIDQGLMDEIIAREKTDKEALTKAVAKLDKTSTEDE